MQISTNEIDHVEILFPEMMSEDFGNKIIATKNRIEELKDKRWKMQQIVMDFDKEIENLEQILRKFNGFYNIIYKTKEVEDTKQDVYFVVKESNGTIHMHE